MEESKGNPEKNNTGEDLQVTLLDETFNLSEGLLQKYNTSGPRYTSYPTAPVWNDDFGPAEYEAALRETNRPGENPRPLSLYAHLPFCEHRCLFCGCNVVITQQREQAEKYLGFLFQEIDRVAELVDAGRKAVQFHWGGGTPTYLSPEQMERLFRFQTDRFKLTGDAEVAIEVDPRVTTEEQIHILKSLGFNRVSLGVQDFEPKVQEAVHRIQPIEMTEAMIELCRNLEFKGINLDLIYGLPHQTVETFARTLDEVIRLAPDRIALYNYAHVPWISPHQKQIPEESLPAGTEKFRIFQLALRRLTGAGYVYIGLDHFAKPSAELSIARQKRPHERGGLHRNFMGYTTQAGTDLLGFGVSAISGLEGYYAQNQKKLSQYYEAVEAKHLPTLRGFALSQDDLLRRALINGILCQGAIDYTEIRDRFGVDVPTQFAGALASLTSMVEDGLIHLTADGLTLTPLGRIFSRNVAMPFDAYLSPATPGEKPLFSKTL